MPKKNREYWQERYEQLEKSAHLYSLSTYAQIEPAFTQAQMEIQKDIDAWYGRVVVNNNVTLQEAKKLLTADELAEFKWDVNEYIKYGKENAINHQWVKQLENASSKYHINKLEALKIRTQQAVEKAFGNELDAVDSMARKVYSNSYYHSIFEMQKGFNMGREIATIDEKALEKIITKPWAADGKNFSDRIWQSKAQLVNELHNQLTRTVLLGNKPDSAIKAISDKFNVSKSQAANLVMTEQTYFHSLATYDSFKSMGIKQYEFLATLDKRTTQMCRSMDGKHFPMSEYMPGATAPPLHPRCRSVTVPYFDDEYSDLFNNGSMRAARNEDDKTYYVPADMNYRDWEKQFVKDAVSKKDVRIFNSIKTVIGNSYPKSIEEFTKIKYNKDDDEYRKLKSYTSSINSGEVTPLADFKLYMEISNEIDKSVVGLKTKNGIQIKGKSNHFISRTIGSVEQRRNGVPIKDIVSAIQNPEAIQPVRHNKNGNSQRFIGKKCMVTVNPDTGILIQVNPRKKEVKSNAKYNRGTNL